MSATPSRIWYATREQVLSALEIAHTARATRLVDTKIGAASEGVESLLNRRFYPEIKTVLKDWPNDQYADPWRIWLEPDYLVSLTSLTSGGITIPTGNVVLRNGSDRPEPPYSSIEILLSSNSAFMSGTTWQQAVAINGLWGEKATDISLPSATLGGIIDSVVMSIVLNPVSGVFDVGVGSIVLIESERLLLVERAMSSTGQTLQSNMDGSKADVIVDVTNGSLYAPGEVILIDAERMRVDDIAGNNLIVTRAWDGTVLSGHNAGATIFALRTFTVRRGMLGTVSSGHTNGTAVYAHGYPPIVNELCVAETVVMLEQNAAGYARTVGSGDSQRESSGAGLEDIRRRAYEAFRHANYGVV